MSQSPATLPSLGFVACFHVLFDAAGRHVGLFVDLGEVEGYARRRPNATFFVATFWPAPSWRGERAVLVDRYQVGIGEVGKLWMVPVGSIPSRRGRSIELYTPSRRNLVRNRIKDLVATAIVYLAVAAVVAVPCAAAWYAATSVVVVDE